MIPTSWRRYQLSQLVNKALSLPKPVPFDFLVRGEILRTTLAEWCAEKGIGEEETLEIEYFESVMPPQKMSTIPHEDWVSSVSCQLSGYFLTASYDGHIRVFDYSQKLLHTASTHSAPIASLCLVPTPSTPSTHLIATASHDLTARLMFLTLSSDDTDAMRTETLASLHLHTAPVASVQANATGTHLLTASWDTLIGVWDTSIPGADEVPAEDGERKKRRRVEEDAPRARRKAPLAVLKSHTARVSKAVFAAGAGAQAYSCGIDSTVRVWDVENGVCTDTITASAKPFLDLAITPLGTSALAASTDRTVSQYDLRASSTSAVTPSTATLNHPATPSCIALPPASSSGTGNVMSAHEHQLLTGAYDGIVRLWDLRSVKSAVASFKTFEEKSKMEKKILSVDWASGVVCVGGEGGVEVWRAGEGDRAFLS